MVTRPTDQFSSACAMRVFRISMKSKRASRLSQKLMRAKDARCGSRGRAPSSALQFVASSASRFLRPRLQERHPGDRHRDRGQQEDHEQRTAKIETISMEVPESLD